MQSGDVVIYIDVKGKEHNALVGATNDNDDKRVSLVYVEPGRDHEFNSGSHENVIHRVLEVPHADNKAANPVNCWREVRSVAEEAFAPPESAVLTVSHED